MFFSAVCLLFLLQNENINVLLFILNFALFFLQEEPLNIWDNFKLDVDYIRAIEGVEKTERKRTQKEKYQKRQIILPAGMDVGRFIEDSLKMYVYYYIFFS